MIKNKKLQTIIFYLLLLLLWQLIFTVGTEVMAIWKSYAFPSPTGVLKSFFYLIRKGNIFLAVGCSLRRCLLGFCIALILGVGIGMLMTENSYFKRNAKPLMLGIQTLPSICWVPFAILWFGLNESAIVFVVVMGSVFSIALSVEDSIRQVPLAYIRVAKTMGLTSKNMYLHVLFPAAFPTFIVGMKQSWSFAWRALMSGEVMSSYVGLGFSLMMGRDMADINQVMAVMLIIIVIGIIIEKFVFGKIVKKLMIKRGV